MLMLQFFVFFFFLQILWKFDLNASALLQSCAVQSGEPIMHYGQSIVEEDDAIGQIPRLLGMSTLFRKYYGSR